MLLVYVYSTIMLTHAENLLKPLMEISNGEVLQRREMQFFIKQIKCFWIKYCQVILTV